MTVEAMLQPESYAGDDDSSFIFETILAIDAQTWLLILLTTQPTCFAYFDLCICNLCQSKKYERKTIGQLARLLGDDEKTLI